MAIGAMQEATLLIVAVLAAGSRHGNGIVADVAEISGGRVRLRPGTLFTALDRLRADGLIGVDREEIVDGWLRRYYRLARAGGSGLATGVTRSCADVAGPAGRAGARAAGARCGRLRASDADRERVIDLLKAAFVQGRLDRDEFDVRVGQVLVAREWSDLAALTADLRSG
jgi:Domain of unknown function (DUF1707)/Transcriptional regulator PadR-like family